MECKAAPALGSTIEGRAVSGFASVFGVVDSYSDIVMPGAFKKLKEGSARCAILAARRYTPAVPHLEMREVGEKQLPDAIRDLYPSHRRPAGQRVDSTAARLRFGRLTPAPLPSQE